MDKAYSITIPEDVQSILDALASAGHKAYAVGGCIRDSILGIEPNDWDISTSAAPAEVKKLFEKTFDTGIQHGTVTVVLNHRNYEVTTFRIDGRYSDGRRPESVEFTASVAEDLSRRDFTMNAIAYNSREGMVDPFGGMEDIRKAIIRTVGTPCRRFEEDALRMLRAVRFSAQLEFSIESNTLTSITLNSNLIGKISSERIRDELNKLLLSKHPDRLLVLKETGLLRLILPELEECFNTPQNHPYHSYNVGEHLLKAVASTESDKILRWTMLLHDVGKPASKTTDHRGIDHFYGHAARSVGIAGNILKRLRFDNKSTDRILRLIEHHDRILEPSQKAVRRSIYKVGDDIFADLLKVQEADKKAQHPAFLQERLDRLTQVREIYSGIKQSGQCLSLQQLAINGQDLLDSGFKPGKAIGEVLNSLLLVVLERPEFNTREKLLELARRRRRHM